MDDIRCMVWGIASLALLFQAFVLARTLAPRIHGVRTARERTAHHRVTQCLRIPSGSPRARQIIAALPHYAAKCLEHAE